MNDVSVFPFKKVNSVDILDNIMDTNNVNAGAQCSKFSFFIYFLSSNDVFNDCKLGVHYPFTLKLVSRVNSTARNRLPPQQDFSYTISGFSFISWI